MLKRATLLATAFCALAVLPSVAQPVPQPRSAEATLDNQLTALDTLNILRMADARPVAAPTAPQGRWDVLSVYDSRAYTTTCYAFYNGVGGHLGGWPIISWDADEAKFEIWFRSLGPVVRYRETLNQGAVGDWMMERPQYAPLGLVVKDTAAWFDQLRTATRLRVDVEGAMGTINYDLELGPIAQVLTFISTDSVCLTQ